MTTLITKQFNGTPFVFREDGWFNMTKAAKHFGKNLSNFWQSSETSAYVEALQEAHGEKMDSIVTAVRGVGTWAHPKLAVFFARWLDVRFAVWCDAVIDDILKGKAEVVITKPAESAVLALPEGIASDRSGCNAGAPLSGVVGAWGAAA